MFWTRSVLAYSFDNFNGNCEKIEAAFQAGYDPALELATNHTANHSLDLIFTGDEPWTHDIRRKEQDVIDRIIHGEESGHYFMFLGPKVGAFTPCYISFDFDFL